MTNLDFGPLSYGAANLGNLYRAVTEEQAFAALEAAWDVGIRYYDTAPHYGLGLSERRLGEFLATKPRHEFALSTKVGRLLRPNPGGTGRLDDEDFVVPAALKRVWDFSVDGIRRSLEESLGRLGLDSVDIVYLHDPERYDLGRAIATGVPGMVRLREEGLVSAIGVGAMTVQALLAGVRTEAIDLLMVAGRYTLAEQSALIDVIPECRRNGVAVVAAAVFNSGLLAGGSTVAKARYDYGAVPEDVLVRTNAIATRCADFGVELAAAALQYPLREPAVRTVVVGAGTPEQIRQNDARMRAEMPEGFWEALETDGLIPS